MFWWVQYLSWAKYLMTSSLFLDRINPTFQNTLPLQYLSNMFTQERTSPPPLAITKWWKKSRTFMGNIDCCQLVVEVRSSSWNWFLIHQKDLDQLEKILWNQRYFHDFETIFDLKGSSTPKGWRQAMMMGPPLEVPTGYWVLGTGYCPVSCLQVPTAAPRSTGSFYPSG